MQLIPIPKVLCFSLGPLLCTRKVRILLSDKGLSSYAEEVSATLLNDNKDINDFYYLLTNVNRIAR